MLQQFFHDVVGWGAEAGEEEVVGWGVEVGWGAEVVDWEMAEVLGWGEEVVGWEVAEVLVWGVEGGGWTEVPAMNDRVVKIHYCFFRILASMR